MLSFRCPKLDLLGIELIDAYRLTPDALRDELIPNTRVDALHNTISTHLRMCPMCREIERTLDQAESFPVPSYMESNA